MDNKLQKGFAENIRGRDGGKGGEGEGVEAEQPTTGVDKLSQLCQQQTAKKEKAVDTANAAWRHAPLLLDDHKSNVAFTLALPSLPLLYSGLEHWPKCGKAHRKGKNK